VRIGKEEREIGTEDLNGGRVGNEKGDGNEETDEEGVKERGKGGNGPHDGDNGT
jgi:hypothetical protein